MTEQINTEITAGAYFSTPIYTVYRPDFLPAVSKVAKKQLNAAKAVQGLDPVQPLRMTGNFYDDPKVADFVGFTGRTSWDILRDQGYAMDGMSVQFSEMWVQEHHKNSSMDQHTHRFGSQVVGFYFLKVPENPPLALFYDPRPGRVQGSLPDQDPNLLTMASAVVQFQPKAGIFIFTNSWLAHSFTRNQTDSPFTFVHFNLSVSHLPPARVQVEVV